jgi:asparagine synthase (glutamine-hydrolysing)
MCGIVGIWQFDGRSADVELVDAMCDRLRHRGPDDRGAAQHGPCAMAMVRLSIIDVQGGHQPIANEAGDVVLICNGEIYNHLELRAGLEARGHQFRTHSDVEVILHLYEECGPAAFEKLNGMFAVAIHDRRRGELILARDRFGQKPLYIWQRGDRLLFSSEAKAFLTCPDFRVEPSAEAIAAYLALRYVPAPLSMFRDVIKLPPASYFRATAAGRTEQARYWSVSFDAHTTNGNGRNGSQSENVWTSLRDAVERHMMSERPVGVFLSGGIDSASIVACLHELGHRSIVTYTAGFAGFEDNELDRARMVADRFRTEHHEVLLEPEEYWDTFGEIVYYLDEPNNATPAPAIFKMARQAVQQLTVVLSGEGSDELLAGYRGMDRAQFRFAALGWLRSLSAVAPVGLPLSMSRRGRAALRWARGTDADYLQDRTHSMTSIFSEEEIAEVCVSQAVRSTQPPLTPLREYYRQRAGWDGLDLIQAGMIQWWLPDNLLALADRLTMAHSLELRCPFLDVEFARCCTHLPASGRSGYPWHRMSSKVALKQAAISRLGADFVELPKRGFVNPANQWLNSYLSHQACREMEREDSLAATLFSTEYRRDLLAGARRGNVGDQTKTWSLILLNRWADRWM